jgi:hypothetical protein
MYATPPAPFPVRFAPSVSYDEALRAVTDLGLQPSVACGFEADVKAGRVISGMQWQPAGQKDIFSIEHRLFVTITPLTAPDWSTRLSRVHGFTQNSQEQLSQPLYCPDLSIGGATYPTVSATSTSVSSTSLDTPQPAYAPMVLTYAQAISSPNALVVFTPSSTYAEALYTISNLGLRLADPCYEHGHSRNQPTSAPWPGGGQEDRYSVSHELIVAVAPLASPIHWDQMLSSNVGVARVTVPFTISC